MKAIVILLAISGVLHAQRMAVMTDWQWMAPFTVENPGIVRLELSPQVLDVSRPDLGDVRILKPGGNEGLATPHLIEEPVLPGNMFWAAPGFRTSLTGRSTVIEVSRAAPVPIQVVTLETQAQEFVKWVTVEGRAKDGEWRTLLTDGVIIRQADGPRSLTLPIPAGVWENLRFTVDDDRSPPVPFTGVKVGPASEEPEVSEMPVAIVSRKEVSEDTYLTLDLGGRNRDLAGIRLEIPDAVFSRRFIVGYSTPSKDGGLDFEDLGISNLYRVIGDRNTSTEELVISINRRVPSRYLRVIIHNLDSPPLTITGAKGLHHPTILTFHAGEAGRWRLLTGNRAENALNHDLNALRETLAQTAGQRTIPDALAKNPDFIAPPIIPGVETAGTPIDLSPWTRRRKVSAANDGVIRIELDASILAVCRDDLGDFRLVQNGNQIPYVFNPGKVTRDLKPSRIVRQSDPERPTLSRWEIMLPVAGLPATDLTARSAATLFTRRFVAFEKRQDSQGNIRNEILGSADWTKSGESQPPLVIHLGKARMPRTFLLDTDHGDNPPITLDDITIRYEAPSIAAKVTVPSPLFVCYGNPAAKPPDYDLRLVWDDLMAADQQATVLGDEEILRPDASGPKSIDTGSPWLWLALGGVVVALLAVVAKLLPRPATA